MVEDGSRPSGRVDALDPTRWGTSTSSQAPGYFLGMGLKWQRINP